MNPQKNQGEETSPLFRDLQAEVSSESAPTCSSCCAMRALSPVW